MEASSDVRRDRLHVGPLELRPQENMAWANGRAVMLTVRELRILVELARRMDRPVSRDELYQQVWGRKRRPGDRSVDVYIRKLRIKLEEALPEWRFIHTHFGAGYRLTPERSAIANDPITP